MKYVFIPFQNIISPVSQVSPVRGLHSASANSQNE